MSQAACKVGAETVSDCIKNTRRHARTGKCSVTVPPIALLSLRRISRKPLPIKLDHRNPRVACSPLFSARLSDKSLHDHPVRDYSVRHTYAFQKTYAFPSHESDEAQSIALIISLRRRNDEIVHSALLLLPLAMDRVLILPNMQKPVLQIH